MNKDMTPDHSSSYEDKWMHNPVTGGYYLVRFTYTKYGKEGKIIDTWRPKK